MIQTAMMTRRLKAADPTMVEGPSAPAKKFPATTSMTDRIISGAEEPSAMRDRLAMVGFQTCTSVIPKPKMSNNRVCVCVCVLGVHFFSHAFPFRLTHPQGMHGSLTTAARMIRSSFSGSSSIRHCTMSSIARTPSTRQCWCVGMVLVVGFVLGDHFRGGVVVSCV